MKFEAICVKYLLFAFNILFFTAGILTIIAGTIIYMRVVPIPIWADEYTEILSIVVIVIGSIVCLVSFFGCCGAILENTCMTITFTTILLTILVIEVALGVFAYINTKDLLDTDIDSAYSEFFFAAQFDDRVADIIGTIQSTLGCCGVYSSDDYSGSTELFETMVNVLQEANITSAADLTDENLEKLVSGSGAIQNIIGSMFGDDVDIGSLKNLTASAIEQLLGDSGDLLENITVVKEYYEMAFNASVPDSCYSDYDVYDSGCLEVINLYIRYAVIGLIGFAISIVSIEVVGVIFSICLTCAIQRDARKERDEQRKQALWCSHNNEKKFPVT